MTISSQDLLAQRWYVVVDDCIGGHAIANVDKPVSHTDHTIGEVEVAVFLTQELAEHIVELHNNSLKEA